MQPSPLLSRPAKRRALVSSSELTRNRRRERNQGVFRTTLCTTGEHRRQPLQWSLPQPFHQRKNPQDRMGSREGLRSEHSRSQQAPAYLVTGMHARAEEIRSKQTLGKFEESVGNVHCYHRESYRNSHSIARKKFSQRRPPFNRQLHFAAQADRFAFLRVVAAETANVHRLEPSTAAMEVVFWFHTSTSLQTHLWPIQSLFHWSYERDGLPTAE